MVSSRVHNILALYSLDYDLFAEALVSMGVI
jgi:hypothetical protein